MVVDKTRNERDLEMRLAEKGTQQEQTSLMQPPETSKHSIIGFF